MLSCGGPLLSLTEVIVVSVESITTCFPELERKGASNPYIRLYDRHKRSVRRLSQMLKNGNRAQLTDGSTFSTVLQTLSYSIFLSGALQKLLCGLCRSRLAGTDYLLLRWIKMAHKTDLGKAQCCVNWEERQPLFYSRQPLLLGWAAGRCVWLYSCFAKYKERCSCSPTPTPSQKHNNN